MMNKYKTANEYFRAESDWKPELAKLRKILLSTPLTEEVKWGAPIYTCNSQNVVGIGGFKNWVALWFYQGALLKDDLDVLINAQTGVTRALRQWRFTDGKQIKVAQVKAYIKEAIDLANSGKSIKPLRNKPLVVPPELKKALASNKKARDRYEKMSKSCRREYAEYISEAKRAETRLRRLKKIMPMIVDGGGLHDKYR